MTSPSHISSAQALERWHVLLGDERLYVSAAARAGQDERSEFERDYDRLIFASPFRRLQDKAQVFPLEHNDFVRTRLTHSLEVSTLGRSLGRQVARRLLRDREIALPGEDVATIVASTCLAHDIGNPPFGHFGEDAIRRWFRTHPQVLDGLTAAQEQDFLAFDGNAQGLRILSFLQSLGHDNGLNLTCATLASFMKYVCSSTGIDPRSKTRKKIGYFQSEAHKVARIREVLELSEARHPLAFLMEAADDIAYSVVDIEDGFKKRVLRPESFVSRLELALLETPHAWLVWKLKDRLSQTRHGSERIGHAIQWFRIESIGVMFQAVVDAFVTHHDAMLEGRFDQELIKVSSASALREVLKEIGQEEVYTAPEILELEVFGDRVVQSLLDRFVPACLSSSRTFRHTLDGKLYALVSPSMRALQETYTRMTPYDCLQLAVDHVCGMTDTYAVAVFEKLNGRVA